MLARASIESLILMKSPKQKTKESLGRMLHEGNGQPLTHSAYLRSGMKNDARRAAFRSAEKNADFESQHGRVRILVKDGKPIPQQRKSSTGAF